MESKITATAQKEEAPEKEAPEASDMPLLGLSDAAVKKLIRSAKKRGYETHDQINSVSPSEEVNSEHIEEETDPDEDNQRKEPEEKEESEGGEIIEVQRPAPVKVEKSEPLERTDDPVGMYLRAMRLIELLSRAGEIAIAKRIEAGREAMIAGLCESPLTFQAIIIWRDELNGGKVFLRDIIDLEATYAGPDAKNVPALAPADGAVGGVPGAVGAAAQPQTVAPVTAPPAATPFRPKPDVMPGAEDPGEPPEGKLDDDDLEGSMSLAAIEAELKPKVLETFDNVADSYKRLRRLQDQDIQFKLKSTTLSPAQERKYKRLKEEIIADVKSLRLNQARIDSLVKQLYDINKRLVGFEGRMMRLAESHGVSREDFL